MNLFCRRTYHWKEVRVLWRENHEAVKCPGVDKCPTPGTDTVKKCPTYAREGGRGWGGPYSEDLRWRAIWILRFYWNLLGISFRHCRVGFYAFFGQPLSKQLYVQFKQLRLESLKHPSPVYYEFTIWLAPSWLESSVGRALHRHRRGHGFESRSIIFLSCVYNCDDHSLIQQEYKR